MSCRGEHKHIANEKLEQEFSGTDVTLRQLLNLDKLSGVPTTWPGSNFDYFWIVDYGNPARRSPRSSLPCARSFHRPTRRFRATYGTHRKRFPPVATARLRPRDDACARSLQGRRVGIAPPGQLVTRWIACGLDRPPDV